MDLTYIEAWQLWFAGTQLSDHSLYGVPIVWWGRGGKLLAFVAGLAVLIDIIGLERIRDHGRRVFTGFDKFIQNDGREQAPRWFYRTFTVYGLLLLAWLFSVIAHFVWGWSYWLIWWWSPLLVPAAFFLVMMAVMVLVAVYSALLTHPALARIASIISLLLFLVGFHFDFLAS